MLLLMLYHLVGQGIILLVTKINILGNSPLSGQITVLSNWPRKMTVKADHHNSCRCPDFVQLLSFYTHICDMLEIVSLSSFRLSFNILFRNKLVIIGVLLLFSGRPRLGLSTEWECLCTMYKQIIHFPFSAKPPQFPNNYLHRFLCHKIRPLLIQIHLLNTRLFK